MFSQEQIERGRSLVLAMSKSHWELGDLTNEVVTAYRERGGKDESEIITMREYADEIGTTDKRLLAVSWVAKNWKPEERVPDVAWEVHRILVTHPDRTEIIRRKKWKINELRAWLDEKPENDTRPRASARKERLRNAQPTEPTVPSPATPVPDAAPSTHLGEITALDFLRQARVALSEAQGRILSGKTDPAELASEIDSIEGIIGQLRARMDTAALRAE